METPEPQWQLPPKPAAKPPDYPRGTRLLVGSAVSFVVASLLYGVNTVLTMLFFATICTIGIGLAVILVACYLVGWVIVEIWKSVRGPQPTSGSASGPPTQA